MGISFARKWKKKKKKKKKKKIEKKRHVTQAKKLTKSTFTITLSLRKQIIKLFQSGCKIVFVFQNCYISYHLFDIAA